MALSTNLVAYYKLDGNSNDSVGVRNGTDTSITYSNANGIINNGAGYNGTGSTISLGTSSTFDIGGGAFSISLWTKPAASASGPYGLFSRRESNGGASPNAGYTLLYADGPNTKWELVAKTTGGATSVVSSTGSHATGSWYHVVLTVDSSGGVVWYTNGASDGTGSITANGYGNAHAVNAYIGQGQDDTTTFLFNGALDEVGVWTRALTSGEVTTLYNGGAGLQYPFTVLTATASTMGLMGVG